VVYFFATQCSYIRSVGNITVEIPHKFPAYWKLLIVNLSTALNIAGLRKLRERECCICVVVVPRTARGDGICTGDEKHVAEGTADNPLSNSDNCHCDGHFLRRFHDTRTAVAQNQVC